MSGFTQSQLDALNAAIASGTLRVTYDGKTIEYRSMAELLQAKSIVERSLQPVASRVTGYNPVYDKGI